MTNNKGTQQASTAITFQTRLQASAAHVGAHAEVAARRSAPCARCTHSRSEHSPFHDWCNAAVSNGFDCLCDAFQEAAK